MSGLFSTERLARGSASHPWLVILAWVILLVSSVAVSSTLFADAVTSEFNLIGDHDSKLAKELLEERLRGEPEFADLIVVKSATIKVDDPAFQQTVEAVVAGISALGPEIVRDIETFYDNNQEFQVSENRQATFFQAGIIGDLTVATEHIEEVHHALDAVALPEGFEVFITGQLTLGHEFIVTSEEDLKKGEAIGILIAIVILTIVFGAVAAMVLPIVMAVMSIAIAIGMAALAGQVFELNLFVSNIITMIGLAVGIDYSLFIVSRFREERRKGQEVVEAIAVAGGTASRAVLFSGMTVVLALIGLLIVPVTVFISLGLGAIFVVIVSVAAGLTLLPAILRVMGDKVNWLSIPKIGSRDPAPGEAPKQSIWSRLAAGVMKAPALSLVIAAGLLLAAGYSYLDISTGTSGVSSLPDGFRSKDGFNALQNDFGFGLDAPADVVIDGDMQSPQVLGAIDALTASLVGDDRFGEPRLETNAANDLGALVVPLSGDPTSKATTAAVEELRDKLIPDAFRGVQANVYIGGPSSDDIDLNDIALQYQPIVFAFVLGLSFILLMIVFRSIVIPATAIIMNLLSVGAAYGLLVLVFQKGIGNEIFGFEQDVIQPWMPLMLFTILFGLSMDYQVFLLSRIQERYNQTKNNAESVVHGVTTTAGLITGAAVIMVAVFAGFAAGRLVPLQQFGFGLAIAVLVDATVVRTVLVPSTMQLLGDRNWYLPSFLGWLPEFRIEAGTELAPEEIPAVGGND
ncbi:MAG: MMPL family transporter [SAR202 cluster bacterium]|jgi:RND superfamily putative drug exporter|nr:MMPL family transporter [SAR202 cluster bacterium]MDP6713886.1 MMPL family transporter [SAR202 cluster bacterium]